MNLPLRHVAIMLLFLGLCLGAVVVANPVSAAASGADRADAPPSAAAPGPSSPLLDPNAMGGGHIFVCDDWHLGKRCRASPLNFRCTRDGHMQYDEPDNRCRDKTRCSCEMPRRLELRKR